MVAARSNLSVEIRMTLPERTAMLLTLVAVSFASGEVAAQDRQPSVSDRGVGEPLLPSREPGPARESEPPLHAPNSPRLLEGNTLAPGSLGGGLGMNSPRGPMGGGGPPGYDALWSPSQSVTGQSTRLGFVRQGLSLGGPLWRGETDLVLASLSVRNTLFSTDALLPDSLRPFPDQLWNVHFGFYSMHRFTNGWSGGLMGGFGSASDKPFHSLDEMTANLGAFLRVPARNGRDSWQFMLLYLYGGPVNFPIPMLSYAWNPSDSLRVNLGLPFSVAWQPEERVMLHLSYLPLNNIHARMTYRVVPRLQVYGGYEFLNESYFLADRPDNQDRFFTFEQRLAAGLRWEMGYNATTELTSGYSFGRNFGQGDSQWGSLTDRVDVDPGPFLGLRFNLKY